MNAFQKATKTKSKLRLAIIAVSGAGKTFTALTLAKGLGERIALVDSEHGSASKYADRFDFDTLELDSFHPQRYIDAIQAADQAGYDVLVIDSLSHAWTGKDGALALVDVAAKRNHGNSYVGWRDVTPLHNQLIDAIVGAKLHVIATMRAKTEYVLEDDARGKKVPRKVGMAPVQRDGMEYEFDVVADMDIDHTFIVTKSRIPSLDGAAITKPDGKVADTLRAWLDDGVAAPVAPSDPTANVVLIQNLEAVKATLSTMSDEEHSAIVGALREAGVESAGGLARTIATHLTSEQFAEVMRAAVEPASFPDDLPDVQDAKPERQRRTAVEKRDADDAQAQAEADELFGAAFEENAPPSTDAYSAGAAS